MMMLPRYIAYYRVSTLKQGQSGLGLEAQQKSVRNYLNGGDWELIKEFVELESGKKNDRPKILEAIELCQATGATLLIAKLDRLARNVSFISNLMDAGVEFKAVDMPEANKFTVHIMAAMAEHEREMISERTKLALAVAKERGVKLGSPQNLTLEAAVKGRKMGLEARQIRAEKKKQQIRRYIEAIKEDGCVTLTAIARELERRKIPTPSGKTFWQPVQVSRIMTC